MSCEFLRFFSLHELFIFIVFSNNYIEVNLNAEKIYFEVFYIIK